MSHELVRELERQERAWRARPLVRRLYREWHEALRERLSPVPGRTVELGSGFGAFRESVPHVVLTDVVPTPWADAVVDAELLPYPDGSLANLVLIDVFHHLARPRRLFDEAVRTLAPGGRLLILDPYCSPVSTVAYRLFHRERTDLHGPGLDDDADVGTTPLDSNQARATIVFFRRLNELRHRWPELSVVERERLAYVVYPLSGGFTGQPLVPAPAGRWLAPLERALQPLAPLLAFRCLVVLERATRSQGRKEA